MEQALKGLTEAQAKALLTIAKYLRGVAEKDTASATEKIWQYLREAKRTGDYISLVQKVEDLSLQAKGE